MALGACLFDLSGVRNFLLLSALCDFSFDCSPMNETTIAVPRVYHYCYFIICTLEKEIVFEILSSSLA